MECGNATFDAYQDVRMVVLLVIAGAVVAKAVMTYVFKREGGLSELVRFVVPVGLFLMVWPMMWDWMVAGAAGVVGPIEAGVGVSVVSAVVLAMLPLVFPVVLVRAAVAR